MARLKSHKKKKKQTPIVNDNGQEIDYIYGYYPIEKDNPIVTEFLQSLKKHKIYGWFKANYIISPLGQMDKSFLNYKKELKIGDLILEPHYGWSQIVAKLLILNSMIKASPYTSKFKVLPIRYALGVYAKDYFQSQNFLVKHSLLYYQILYGILSTIIGSAFISMLIFHLWGLRTTLIIALMTIFFIIIGISKLKTNISFDN